MSDLLGLPCVHGEDATMCSKCWETPTTRVGMFNYPLEDMQGNVLGCISLETEDLPKAMIGERTYRLSLAYVKGEDREDGKDHVLHFTVVPQPKIQR